MLALLTITVASAASAVAPAAAIAVPHAGKRCSPLWPDKTQAGCWVWDWQFSFHPVTMSSPAVGDSSGGLFVDGMWHTFYSCTGGWCHLETEDLVHYESHGIISPKVTGCFRRLIGP